MDSTVRMIMVKNKNPKMAKGKVISNLGEKIQAALN